MKPFCTRFFAAFLFLVCAYNAKAVNDTLTIGFIFNWQVGDTFIYRPIQAIIYTQPITTYSALKGFTILSKQANGDSIIYQLKYSPSGTIDYLHVAHIDSSIASFQTQSPLFSGFWGSLALCHSNDSLCTDTSFLYIDTLLNYIGYSTSNVDPTGYGYTNIEEKIGLKNAGGWFNGDEENGVPPHGNYMNLVYYSSGTSKWMDSTLYYYTAISNPDPSPSFRLFPNPASDELTITTDGENSSPFDINIYDIMGNCLLAHKNISHNMENFKVLSLPPGYYLLKLTDGHSTPACKGFIIAR